MRNKNQSFKQNTLRNWYIDYIDYHGQSYKLAFGAFFSRPGIADYTIGHTSSVLSIIPDYNEKEYLIQTKNNIYHCRFDSCFFERQDDSKVYLDGYNQIKAEYYKPINTNKLAQNDMLLVLSDLCEYNFETLIYFKPDGTQGKVTSYPHIGMFSDSFIIEDVNLDSKLDIRWYVNYGGIEFYSLKIGKRNLIVENRGDSTISITNGYSITNVAPGVRKFVIKRAEPQNNGKKEKR